MRRGMAGDEDKGGNGGWKREIRERDNEAGLGATLKASSAREKKRVCQRYMTSP